MIVLCTDAPFHTPQTSPGYPGAGFDETRDALREDGVIVIGLASGGSTAAMADLSAIALPTGGAVLALSSDSREIAVAVASAIDVALGRLRLSLREVSAAGIESSDCATPPAAWLESDTVADGGSPTPGSVIAATATLEGRRDRGVLDQRYEVRLWRRAGSALLARYAVTITVPRAE